MDSNTTATESLDSLTFKKSFNKWTNLFSIIINPNNNKNLLCESNSSPTPSTSTITTTPPPSQSWESGKIMKAEGNGEGSLIVEKSESELKLEAKECKRCEGWRDDLIKTSK